MLYLLHHVHSDFNFSFVVFSFQLGLDSMQLLHHASPIIAVGMLCLIPLGLIFPGFDIISGPGSLMEYEWDSQTISWIMLTCILAFGVNVTNYLVIARTSPVTYQVIGHLKTCLILVLGFVVFKYPVVMRNLAGIVLAMVGMIWYTEVKRTESQACSASCSGRLLSRCLQ
jgi:solute carrier family 35 protein E3